MLRGAVGPVAEAALTGGADGARRSSACRSAVRCSRCWPRPPPTSTDALGRLGEAAVEWKLDGVRVQVHRSGSDVTVCTRSLDDITDRVPEVVEAALSLPVRDVVLDGEAIALRAGRPAAPVPGDRRAGWPPGSTSPPAGRAPRCRRTSSTCCTSTARTSLDRPGRDRAAVLERAVPDAATGPATGHHRRAAGGRALLADAVARGHEGVVVKSLDAPYEAGRRGDRLAQGEAAAHARPRRAGRRVGTRPAPRAGCRTCTSGPATAPAASSCSARRSRG